MVSIVDVEVSNDLQNARIFVSIYGDEAAQQQTMEGLASATPFVRREIGQRLGLRRVPTVVFLQDRSLERGSRVLALLNQLRQPAEAQQQEGSHPGVEGRMADTPGGEEDELSEQQ
jgi:ribosome-binding factor A